MEASYCYMLDEAKKRQQQQQQQEHDESSGELNATEDVTEQFDASGVEANHTEMEAEDEELEESSAVEETVDGEEEEDEDEEEEERGMMTHDEVEDDDEDEDTINEEDVDEEEDSETVDQQQQKTPTIESVTRDALSLENDDHNLDTTTNINDLNQLKKNLANEEEFRSINQSEPIHIFLKLKPITDKESTAQNHQKFYKLHSDTTISLVPPKNCVYAQNKQSTQTLTNTLFQFSYIFQPDIKQAEFFQATIFPCMEKFFNGDNLLIFSYGVTNSGKTYTMQGPSDNPGLIPRTLDLLFDSLKSSLETKKAIYQFKPEKFNEICSLSDAELTQELNYKESLLKLSTYKEAAAPITTIGRHDSCDTLAASGLDSAARNLESSKKFGSLDSLLIANNAMNGGCDLNSEPNRIKVSPNKKYALWICFYELYNDMVYDLLTLPRGSKPSNNNNNNERPALKIREDINRVPYVEGLVHIPVFNTLEAIKVLKYGEKNLQKSSNSINQSSSRSHAIFCLKLVCIENSTIKNGSSFVQINQLSFCDLAGIERTSKTQAVGKTQKEASTINTSLLALSRCIETMMQNQKNKNNQMQVPYRVNKLTRLFQAYFEGRGMVKMIVNLNPAVTFFNENVNVLKFASIANKIQIGLNDEDKVQYKIEAEEAPVNNRLTVAWEVDKSSMTGVEEGDDEEEEEDDEDEDEEDDDTEVEEETMAEESGEEEEEDDDEDEGEEEEEEEEEETDEEEDETESETTMEQSGNETAKVNVKFKIPPICGNKNKSAAYPKTPVPVKKTVNKTQTDGDTTRETESGDEDDDDEEDDDETEEEETDEEEDEEEEEEEEEEESMVADSIEQESSCEASSSSASGLSTADVATAKTPRTASKTHAKTSKSILKSALKSDKKLTKQFSVNVDDNDSSRTSTSQAGGKKRKTEEKLDTDSPIHKRASLESSSRVTRQIVAAEAAPTAAQPPVINAAANENRSFFEAMSQDALIDYIIRYIQNRQREMLKLESEIRKEIVDRWSKRVEDTEVYFQEQIEKQRDESEIEFQNRLALAEKLIHRNSQLKLAEAMREATRENEARLEKLREEFEKASKERDELDQRLAELVSSTSAATAIVAEPPVMSHQSLQTDSPSTVSTGVDADSNWLNEIEQSFTAKLEESHIVNREALEKLDSQIAEYNQLRADYNRLCEIKKQAEAELSQKLNEQIAQAKYFQQKEIEAKTQYTEALSKNRQIVEQLDAQIELMATINNDLAQVKANEEAARKELEARINELSKRADEAEERANKASKELEEALSRVQKQEEKIKELNQDLDSSTKLTEMLNENFVKLDSQRSQMSERIQQLQLQLDEVNNEMRAKCEEIKQLEAQCVASQNELEPKDTEIEMLKNEVFFKQNQIEKLEAELEDRKRVDAFREVVVVTGSNSNSKSKLTSGVVASTSASSLFEANQVVSVSNKPPPAAKKEKLIRDERDLADEEMLVEEETTEPVVMAKPPSRSTSTRQAATKSSITPTTSSASLRKANTRSTSRLHDIEPSAQSSLPVMTAASTARSSMNSTSASLANIDEEVKPVAKVTRKGSRATSSSSKLKKSKQAEEEVPADEVIDEPPVVAAKKNKKESIVVEAASSIQQEAAQQQEDSNVELTPEAPKKSANIKKKSTLSRLADIITKSPILEPLRNRPTRKTTLKQSNLSEEPAPAVLPAKAGSLDRKLKSILKEKPAVESSLQKIQDEEENAENIEPEDTKTRKTRKRRAAV